MEYAAWAAYLKDLGTKHADIKAVYELEPEELTADWQNVQSPFLVLEQYEGEITEGRGLNFNDHVHPIFSVYKYADPQKPSEANTARDECKKIAVEFMKRFKRDLLNTDTANLPYASREVKRFDFPAKYFPARRILDHYVGIVAVIHIGEVIDFRVDTDKWSDL